MPLTVFGKNKQANSVAYNKASIHTQAPTDNGSAGELTGGSPAYARQLITMGAASNGVRSATNQPIFDIPPNVTITHYALWNATVCVATGTLSKAEAYAGQGKYTLTGVTVTTA